MADDLADDWWVVENVDGGEKEENDSDEVPRKGENISI